MADRPEDVAYQFLPDGEEEERSLTWGQLEQRADRIAGAISEITSPGDRILLVFAPGLEFIESFLACQLCNRIPVPTYPPKLERAWQGQRIVASISGNCRPAVVLTGGLHAGHIKQLLENLPELAGVPWISSDVAAESGRPFRGEAGGMEDLSLLQYTSGSTGDPKGVMVTQRNLLHNERMMQIAFGHTKPWYEYAAGVCWLPPYHDMGLMGHILHNVYVGFPCAIIPPLGILQWPIRWLRSLTKYRADASGGPNFIYELCSTRIPKELRAGLDLSYWNTAVVGAEPIRAQTLDDFCTQYEPFGFRRTTLQPCYGLAEATLFVTGTEPHQGPVVKEFPRILAQGESIAEAQASGREQQRLVSSGHAWMDTSVEIVDPDTKALAPGRVGEIWVSNESVTAGYWDRPDATRETFGQTLGSDPRRYLRTGDLGFLDGGELYVVGRLKDLIIIRGKNFHPQDIEDIVQLVHPVFRRDCGAAFGVDIDGEERLIVVQEIDRQTAAVSLDELRREVQKAVVKNFDLRPYDIVFLRNGTLPKTTSGKVQRRETRNRYLTKALTLWERKR